MLRSRRVTGESGSWRTRVAVIVPAALSEARASWSAAGGSVGPVARILPPMRRPVLPRRRARPDRSCCRWRRWSPRAETSARPRRERPGRGSSGHRVDARPGRPGRRGERRRSPRSSSRRSRPSMPTSSSGPPSPSPGGSTRAARRVVFHLRPGPHVLRRHAAAASDVVRSWLRLIDPDGPSPLASLAARRRGRRGVPAPGRRDPAAVGLRADDATGDVDRRPRPARVRLRRTSSRARRSRSCRRASARARRLHAGRRLRRAAAATSLTAEPTRA